MEQFQFQAQIIDIILSVDESPTVFYFNKTAEPDSLESKTLFNIMPHSMVYGNYIQPSNAKLDSVELDYEKLEVDVEPWWKSSV